MHPEEHPCWHDVPQPEHPSLHLLIHVPEHVPEHEPKQLLVQPVAACITLGKLESITAPTTGNAAFAAFLKNSLRDWSSSSCFLLDIKLKFLLHRNSQLCGIFNYE